jgi:hypothetical protein
MKKVVFVDANEFALFNEGEQLGLHIPADDELGFSADDLQ